MKILKVNTNLDVDIGVTMFSLYPDDLIFVNEKFEIGKIGYHLQELNIKGIKYLDVRKSRIKSSVRVRYDFISIEKLIGEVLSDITIQHNRNIILEELFQ